MSLAANDTLRRVLSPAQRAALRKGDDAVRGLWRRQHALHRMMAYPLRSNLDLLARVYGTDKSSRLHGYTQHYAEHLKPIRHEVRSVLEIGIGGLSSRHGYDTEAGGMSLRMWQDFFPHARIVGMDIERKVVTGERISVEQGSQDDPVFLADLAARYGPFDIVIDDGSHIGRHVRASLDALFDHVRPGGFYIIEDLAMAYVKDWEGGPPGTPGTQTELIKPLVDDVLRRHWDEFGSARAMGALHLYDQILFIQKAA